MISSKNTVLKITAKKIESGFLAEIISKTVIESCVWYIRDADGEIMASGEIVADSERIVISAGIPAEMWSVENPVLYLFEALLISKEGEERICDRFGFRYFETDENYIYLNGSPFYMRAYIRGCAAHEHGNNCGLDEKDFYVKNMLMAKRYGFNAIRFHSVIPSEACFEAADELGMLLHIETRADNQDYENLTEMLYGKDNFVTDDELAAIINRLYNHPSLMVYCVGNEIRNPGRNERIKQIHDYIKKNDPTRLFLDTCAHGEYDRKYVDFDVQHMGYFFPYGKHRDMFANTENLLCFGNVSGLSMTEEDKGTILHREISFNRPLIAHEVCHYVSWRDFYTLKKKFAQYGKEAPWWVDEEIKMLEAKGYKDNFKKLLQVTKNFQYRCWKTALEAIRASNILSGFHMLQFADTDRYENSNGVVDCFDEEQGISAEKFRCFNGDTVILARLDRQVYESGEKFSVPVFLSQYAIHSEKYGDFHYTLSYADGIVYSTAGLKKINTEKFGVYKICSLSVTAPEVKKAAKLILSTNITFENSICTNSWEMWIFPKHENKLQIPAQNKMEKTYLNDRCRFDGESNLIITDKLNDDMFDILENGANVLLLYRTDWTRHLLHKNMKAPKYSFRHTWERFKGVIWDRGTINGGYDNNKILNKYGFPTDGEINFQYYNLIEDSDKINLDDFPIKVNSLVSGIDKCNRDRFDPGKFKLPELMYDRTMRNFSYAFELCVGKGKLLVTGMNFTGVETGDCASCAMLKALADYCASEEFAPKNSIETGELKSYLLDIAKSGPQKEGMMTQYWQLDDAPVESMEYWKEAERYLLDTENRGV